MPLFGLTVLRVDLFQTVLERLLENFHIYSADAESPNISVFYQKDKTILASGYTAINEVFKGSPPSITLCSDKDKTFYTGVIKPIYESAL